MRMIKELKQMAERQDPCEHIWNSSVVLDLIERIEDHEEGLANELNYADLKDENRRLQDLLDMHEKAQDRQLDDNASLEQRTQKLENVARVAKDHIKIIGATQPTFYRSSLSAALEELDK